MPKIIYGCQSVGRNSEGKLEHRPPIVVLDGDELECGKVVAINGPSWIVNDRQQRPPEVERCKDHSHTIWLQTDSPVIVDPPTVQFHAERPPNRIWICTTVARAPVGEYSQGPVVFDSPEGQRCAHSVKLLGPSRVVFDEHNPVQGYCPCKVVHPHRMWIETYGIIEIYGGGHDPGSTAPASQELQRAAAAGSA